MSDKITPFQLRKIARQVESIAPGATQALRQAAKEIECLTKDKKRLDWLDGLKPIIQVNHTVTGAWEINHPYLGRMGGVGPLRDVIDRGRGDVQRS